MVYSGRRYTLEKKIRQVPEDESPHDEPSLEGAEHIPQVSKIRLQGLQQVPEVEKITTGTEKVPISNSPDQVDPSV